MSQLSLPQLALLIDGEWRAPKSGRHFDTVNPATEEIIARVAEADRDDVDAAVQSAHRAFVSGVWSRRSGIERARVLWAVAARLREMESDIAVLESVDAGKPLAATKRQDIRAAVDCLEYFAGWADKLEGRTVPVREDALTYVSREPLGVVAAIVPWNFPLMNAMWKLAPALACGCSVVLKPAELTPLSALRLGEIFLDCGLPRGVLNIVPGYGHIAGQALVEHPLVSKISFTGSPGVGKHIMRTAAERAIRVGLELGGKSPALIMADADLDAAARAIASGAFFNAGQVCSAATRVLVAREAHDRFVDLLTARMAKIRTGDPLAGTTTMGPVISQKQQRGILDAIDTAKKQGAMLAYSGECDSPRGFFVPPTLFTDVAPDMAIAQKEIFGPVLGVTAFDSEEDGIALANDSRYSLAASVWSQDIKRAHRLAKAIRAGTVWVNTYGHTDTRLPWGGMGGESGVGRDLGRDALDNYTEQKAVWVQL
jgi:aldehyde dehydrogenase (NAD+)